MMRKPPALRSALLSGVAAALILAHATPAAATVVNDPTAADRAIPRYDHIITIIEENKSAAQIVGQSFAPNINSYASTYGSASNYYGVVHPSEGNYVAMIGGSTFGINNDDAYYCSAGSKAPDCFNLAQPGYANHTISEPSLLDQLTATGRTFKGYYENLPAHPKAVNSAPLPSTATPNPPSTSTNTLYASKHNAFINFASVQNDPNIGSKIVGFSGLAADLASGTFANYVHIVPNQCNEMHGLNAGSAPNCDYGAFGVNTADANTQTLISQGDKVIKGLVDQITAAPFWNQGNNAIVLSWDEDNFVAPFTQGCCGSDPASAANFGGGRVANVVITSKGPRGVTDNTPYNHYSFLRTVEDAFGLYDPSQYSAASAGLAGYLNEAGDTVNGVRAQTQLFAANVPEPASLALLAMGVTGCILRRRRG